MNDRIFLIKHCLTDRCKVEDNWTLSQIEEYFYTLKAIICILFGRRWQGGESRWYKVDFVTVAIHSFYKYYNYEFGMDDASFTDITVGHGVFSNWFFFELSDGWL